ncbi:hypothetical protein [Cytobacillus firmus]|uniref:hypothetical protein n=1 Tax=Cytobacillus firmus TaxID=1399 RepID=UPI0018CED191|nr:hypothetical protein [Cytobacillus firmus]MBG9588639.1 hypothetical protein [Cytobacillus firmus]
MNNMNDAYNRIYRFHGRNDIDNLSITEQDNSPMPIHFSQMNQDIIMTSDSLNNKDGNTRGQFSAPNTRSKRSKSKPFILPPPATEARQIFRSSKTQKTANEKNTLNESEEKKTKVNKILSEKQRIQNLRASYLLTPFSPMLTWSPSLPSKNPSIRTQFFLANKSSKIIEQFNYLGNSLRPSLANEQENDSVDKQPTHDDKDSAPLRNTPSLQDEYSLMLDESEFNKDESHSDETLQNGGSEEISQSIDKPLEKEKKVNYGTVMPFQMLEKGLKLDPITLQEDFIELLRTEKDDDEPEILEQSKYEGNPSEGSPPMFDNEYCCIESESLNSDTFADEKDASSLDEKFLLMLTESSSEEFLNEESKVQQDEVFSVLSGIYSDRADSSSEENIHSSMEVLLDNINESSSSGSKGLSERSSELLEETSSFLEPHPNEVCILDKQDFVGDIESSSEFPSQGEFSKMLEKAYGILEVLEPEENPLDTAHKNRSSTIQEIFTHLLDGAFDSSDSSYDEMDCCKSSLDKVSELLRSFSLMLNDADEQKYISSEENTFQNENCCLAENESSSNSGELCSSETESDYFESSCNVTLEESLFIEESSMSDESLSAFEHHCDESEDSSSAREESSSNEESSNLQEEFEHELLADEEKNPDPTCEHKLECVPKMPMPIVKIPVLVGKLEIEIDIFDSFPLHLPIKKITKLEWSIKSLDTNVVLPSNTIFIKGTLIADIEYVNPEEKTSLHSIKVPIMFDKTSEVCWLFPPDLPQAKTQNEFTFKSDGCDALDTHYESTQFFTEKIESQLRCINFVWHNDLADTGKPGLQVQGRALLEIDLLQQQYVDLF